MSHRTGLPHATFHDPVAKDVPLDNSSGKTPHALLIERAAEVRATDPDYYARIIGQQILAEVAATGQRRFVISDWRYRRENEYLRSIAGLRIMCTRVERPGIQPSTHQSEHDVDCDPTITVTMDNKWGLAELSGTVRLFLQILAPDFA